MKTFYKGIVFALTAAILFSLCLTPTAFATEELPDGGDAAIAFKATPTIAVEDTVSTGEELKAWLVSHEDTGGAVKLTEDISLSDFYYARSRNAEAVTIDTGEFSIIASGYVYLQATSPLTIRGIGGEQGVLRSSGQGNMLHLYGLALKAEDGNAVFQEEGTGFILENTAVSGDVHYAQQPFVTEWKPVLVVVERGKTLDAGLLPATLSARVNHQGQVTPFYQEVPITWDLAGHEEEQKLRRRFSASGVFENIASQNAPRCTVAYDDFPLTFLEVNVRKTSGTWGESYRFHGTFSAPADRLPITVTQEYSFDGKTWAPYQETTAETPRHGFSISLFVENEELENVPEFFIRLRWNDDETVYYSNVLRIAADSYVANEEPGGNRGGGTTIVIPSEPPEPDPKPETSEPTPNQPEDDNTNHESNGIGAETISPPESSGGSHSDESSQAITQNPDLPESSSDNESTPPLPAPTPATTPELVSEPALPNKTMASSAIVEEDTKKPAAAADPSLSHTPSAPAAEPLESPAHIPAVKDAPPDDTIPSVASPAAPPATDDTATTPPSEERAEVLTTPAVPRSVGLPLAAGLAVIAVSIGGAAFYLHPKVWQTLLGKLRNLIRR